MYESNDLATQDPNPANIFCAAERHNFEEVFKSNRRQQHLNNIHVY